MLEGGKPVPESLSARLAKLEEAGRRDPKHAAEVTEKTRRIGVALHEAARRYNWHIVKVNLLRDLVARARRVRFYLQEAMRPAEGGHGDVPLPEQEARGRLAKLAVKGAAADVELGPVLGAQGSYRIKARYRMRLDELADETRRWTTEWGEAFFLQREARLLDRPAPADRGLAIMERLASELDQLEGRREALTADVLAFLGAFDKDGKFQSLGIPRRSKDRALDADGRPREVLFCTSSGTGAGGPGVEYEEPLCFDVVDFRFYSQALPLKTRGVLDLESPSFKRWREELDGAIKRGFLVKQPVTVQTHTNPHLLLAGKLLGEAGKDPALLLANSAGEAGGWINIWHLTIRKLQADNLAAVARYFKGVPNFVLYDKLTWEPGGLTLYGSKSGGIEGGYNPEAVAAFRLRLREKFGDIAALNRAWRTKHADFDAIGPPPDAFPKRDRRATPLTYEWEVFRMDSYIDYLTMCAEAIRREDPGHPLAVEVGTLVGHFVNGWPSAYRAIAAIPAEYVEDHYNNWHGSYTSLNLLYSLCLYAGSRPIQMEYIWTYPRLATAKSEDDFRVTGELSVWPVFDTMVS